jgi:hypothetical protein
MLPRSGLPLLNLRGTQLTGKLTEHRELRGNNGGYSASRTAVAPFCIHVRSSPSIIVGFTLTLTTTADSSCT